MSGYDVLIAGGGASGLMCAVHAARRGLSCAVIEKKDRCGIKLSITGKGRCNVTNDSDNESIMRNIPRNPKFMYSALEGFSSADTKAFFEGLGVPLKTERGNRVFPVSDKAHDIVDALTGECRRLGVKFIRDEARSVIIENGRAAGLVCKGGEYFASNVVIACGGRSYPGTGSDGSGYEIARSAGHTVTEITPSLCPIVCKEQPECAEAMGLSLRNCTLYLYKDGKKKPVYSELGEMLFTHFGLSGPLVLSASAHMTDIRPGRYRLEIDLKPALDTQTLDKRLLRDFSENINKDLINSLSALLPSKLIAPFISLTGIPADKKINSVTAQERKTMVGYLKHLPLTVRSAAPVSEAIITRGGVNVRELDPKTMQSKLVPGLYFAGEVIDCDAYTGGFNLQIAFQTANAAALSASGS